MDPGLGSNHDSKREVLGVMFSSVMDLADNFDAFLTSKVNSSFSKTSFPGAFEFVITTKIKIHHARPRYHVITQTARPIRASSNTHRGI